MPRGDARRLGAAAAAASLLAACGGSVGGGDPETVTESVDLSGVQITVGSKDFTEQLILGQVTTLVLQAAGATVQDRTGLASTSAAREALEAGAIDMYWEYTGTGWLDILGHSRPIPDPAQQFDAVAAEDLQQNDVQWLGPPAPANNTYALAVRNDATDEDVAAVTQLSDLGPLIEQSPDKATLCVAAEFAERSDGLPGLERAYGFEFPAEAVKIVEQESLVYSSVDSGRACNFGEVFRTDGRSDALGLSLLEDDKDYFAVYNPALTARAELIDQYPELAELFTPVAAALDEQTLQELSAAVAVDGRPVRDVVEEFLAEEEFLTPQQLTK